jgi:hypothetical protein
MGFKGKLAMLIIKKLAVVIRKLRKQPPDDPGRVSVFFILAEDAMLSTLEDPGGKGVGFRGAGLQEWVVRRFLGC